MADPFCRASRLCGDPLSTAEQCNACLAPEVLLSLVTRPPPVKWTRCNCCWQVCVLFARTCEPTLHPAFCVYAALGLLSALKPYQAYPGDAMLDNFGHIFSGGYGAGYYRCMQHG